jgi:hypothetical protein
VPQPRRGAEPGTVGDGKVPAIAWRAFQDRLPTEAEICSSFRTEQNIAVIVIDADTPDAARWCVQHLPRTPWQTETSRGFHLWYRHPGVPVQLLQRPPNSSVEIWRWPPRARAPLIERL